MSEQYDNSCALWTNDKREGGTHPHFKGSAMVDGVEYWASCWLNTDAGNKPALKIRFTKKEVQAESGPNPIQDPMAALAGLTTADTGDTGAYVPGADDKEAFNDDIPF